MARPTSFRLSEELLDRLNAESRDSSTSVTSLVAMILDEGLKIRRFPGIVYRDGPAGRRAGLASGPDVWEIISALRATSGRGLERAARLAADSDVPVDSILLAVDFYSAFPDEIDDWIEENEKAGARARAAVDRRDGVLG